MADFSYSEMISVSENAAAISQVVVDVQATAQFSDTVTPAGRGGQSFVDTASITTTAYPVYQLDVVASSTAQDVVGVATLSDVEDTLHLTTNVVEGLAAPTNIILASTASFTAYGFPVTTVIVGSVGECSDDHNLRVAVNTADRIEVDRELHISCYSEHNIEEHLKAYIGWTTAWWTVVASTATADDVCMEQPYQLLTSRAWGWVGARTFNIIREQTTDVGRFSGTAIRCREELAVSTAVMDSVGIRGVRLFPTTESKGYARSTATNTNKTNALFISWLDARSSISSSLYERVVDSMTLASVPDTAAYVLLVSDASADSTARSWQLPAPLTSHGTLHSTCALGVSTTSSSVGGISGEWFSHVRSHVNFTERLKETSAADMHGRVLATYVDRLRATPSMTMRLTTDTTDSLQVQGGEVSGVYNILTSNMTSSSVATATSVGRGDIVARARLMDATKTALAELAMSSGNISAHSWGDVSLAVSDTMTLGATLAASTTTMDNIEDRLRCSAAAGHYTAVVVSSSAQFSDYRHVMVEV